MKKLNRILMGGLVAVTAASCSQNPDLPGWNPNGETIRIRLDAPEALQTTQHRGPGQEQCTRRP